MTRTASTPITTRPARATPRDWAALVVLMLPVLIVSIDNTALGFALPDIARELQPSAQAQLWIVDAYPLVLAGLLVAMGNLGDRIGRRRLLLIGATGFAIVSVLAAMSTTAEMLVAMRGLLGLFGATLMPSTLSLLRTTFVDRTQRRLAIAVWATGFSVGSAIGPIVGGLLLAHFAWGSVFLIAVPVLLPLLVLAPFVIRESRDPSPGRIDLGSIVLSIVALAALAAGIKHIAADRLDVLAALLLVAAVVAGAWFVRRMLRTANPMLDVRLLAIPAFSGALLVNLLSVVALTGYLFFITQHLQLVVGLDVIDAALVLAPGAAAMVVAGLSVVWIVRRVRPGLVVAGGLTLSLLGYVVLASAPDTGVAVVLVAFVLLGVGIGSAETLSNDLVISIVPEGKAGAASAVSETAYEIGAVLGTAVLGGILAAVYRGGLVLPAGVGPVEHAAATETLAGAMTVADSLGGELGAQVAAAARAAFEHGVLVTSVAGAALMAVAVVVAFATLRRVET